MRNRPQVGADHTTAPAPSFHALLAKQERFTTWRYTLKGKPGELVMVASEPISRDEALKGLSQHYGCHNVLTLKGGQDAG